ncbi:hypothetical protein Bpfe_023372, partial [Biomphalaria pfeifferi]
TRYPQDSSQDTPQGTPQNTPQDIHNIHLKKTYLCKCCPVPPSGRCRASSGTRCVTRG